MSSVNREAIEERIRLFAQCIRDESNGFKPEHYWWVLDHNEYSNKKYPNAFSLLEQLGISVEDMKSHVSAYWKSKIGGADFGADLRQGQDKKCILITVRSDSPQKSNTSPLDSNSKIVGVAAANTRYPPWVLLKANLLPS